MKYLYYPGCTLKEKAKNYDISGRASCEALGIEIEELANWTCCGTVFPLTHSKIVGMLAPVRMLMNTRDQGRDKLLTLCTFCYNVLKRANYAVKTNELERKRVNAYLKDELEREGKSFEPYEGEVEPVHLLEVLRDDYSFEELKEQVKRPLAGLKVAPYYGCLLLRPKKEVELDDAEHPTVLEDMLKALGAEVIDDFPHKLECCGSYVGISSPEPALQSSADILHMAKRFGADALALACPLCSYNLDTRQEAVRARFPDFSALPVLYFTQLLGLAMDLGEDELLFDQHAVDPRPMLRAKDLLQAKELV